MHGTWRINGLRYSGGALRRSLGLWDAMALVIGCVIGAGIFRMPASVAGQLQAPGLILAVWLVGGFVSFCGALCYAELGAAYPGTGGDYLYLTKAYGPLSGFLFGWVKLFTERIGTIAILGYVFAEYLGSVIGLGSAAVKWLALGAIGVLTAANIVGVHVGKGVQNFLTALKIAALLAIIAVGFASGRGRPELLTPWWPAALDLSVLQGFGVALVFVLWTYGGWTESSYVGEEIRDPHRNLPWSILYGLGIVTLLYLAVNLVYLLYIPLAEMPGRPLVAAEVMRKALGPAGGTLTALMVASSAFGALNGYILTSGRILLALGRDHPVFRQMACVHPDFATPARALAFNGLLAAGLVWLGTLDQIATYSTVVISVFFAMTALAVMVLRRADPETLRPYRVWGYPVTPVIFVLAMVLFIADVTVKQPREALFGFGLMILGFPLYAWSRSREGYRESRPVVGDRRVPGTGFRAKVAGVLVAASVIGAPAPVQAVQEEELARERERMVATQIEARGIRDPKVLAAMRKVPRHRFVPADMRRHAYEDGPLPIGEGQTISQPYIVALMTELAEVDPGDKVLEIGTGSGYQAAILGEIAPHVFTIEILPMLAARAEEVLREMGYLDVVVRVGDGYLGWPEHAPFDAIVVTAAPPEIPKALVDQLAEGGVMVVPVGPEGGFQELVRVRKRGGKVHTEKGIPVRFVPMIHE